MVKYNNQTVCGTEFRMMLLMFSKKLGAQNKMGCEILTEYTSTRAAKARLGRVGLSSYQDIIVKISGSRINISSNNLMINKNNK